MPVVRLARHAMATRFELVLYGGEAGALRAAGEEALEQIERLEERLSLFRPSSEVAHLNARASAEPVRVTPGLFNLLEHARDLHRATLGAFDITIAPLVRCWGFMGDEGRVPGAEALAEARAKVGMHLVELERSDLTVRFARAGVMLDLGAIGKGYAIERAAELLRESGVESALLHGGTSTVYGLGHPPEAESWRVAVEQPELAHRLAANTETPGAGESPPPILRLHSDSKAAEENVRAPLTVVPLRDQALSVSAVWGKFFKAGGETFGHIIDPRDGQPARRALLAAVALPSATESDALSTALLTLGLEGTETLAAFRPEARTLVVAHGDAGLELRARGFAVEHPNGPVCSPQAQRGSTAR